jgi:hypothetical protein
MALGILVSDGRKIFRHILDKKFVNVRTAFNRLTTESDGIFMPVNTLVS